MVDAGRGAPLDRPLTYRDLDETPDDGSRYEVIDGALIVTPFPSYAHQEAVGQLFRILDEHVRGNALGKVFPPGLKVVLEEASAVGPDLVFISTARMADMKPDGYYGAPDLVVEVVSSKPHVDRVIKAQKYAQAGIPHYWIVDPDERLLSAYRLQGAQYQLEAEAGGSEVFEPGLFPGLVIHLERVWV